MRGTVLFLLSGLAFATLVPVSGLAQPAPLARPSQGTPYADHIAEAAKRFKLPAAWIRAVLRAESAGDPRAISPKGAMGLMQIMPGTWADLRARHRLGGDPYDPHDNIIAGAAYIRELFDRYGSPGWIAAYNAGPSRYGVALRSANARRDSRLCRGDCISARRRKRSRHDRNRGSRSLHLDPRAAVHRTTDKQADRKRRSGETRVN